jgi:hypothetical protein
MLLLLIIEARTDLNVLTCCYLGYVSLFSPRYGHQLVIGNLLHTRKNQVFLYDEDGSRELRLSDKDVEDDVEIEHHLISEVVARHKKFYESCSPC